MTARKAPASASAGASDHGADSPSTGASDRATESATANDPSARAARVLGWTRPAVRGLTPYYKAPLQGDPIRLDQNTPLQGPNPAITQVDPARLEFAQYPTRDGDDLLAALADLHGLTPDHFVVGNGSDEVLDLLTKAFTAPGQTLATPWPSYSLYPFYATLQDLKTARVPLRGGFRLDVDTLIAANAALTLVATPNNPTGNRVPRDELERLLTETDGIVVVDEAYIEYAGLRHSLLPAVEKWDNLVVMRTFSKAYGLAGLRVGYLAANTHLTERLRLVKPPFNLNRYSEAVAVQALAQQEWVDAGIQSVLAERDRLTAVLKRHGFRVHPSDANFLLCDSPIEPGVVLDGLRKHGILIRAFPGAHGLEHCVRFTVGLPEHTDRVNTALAEVMA